MLVGACVRAASTDVAAEHAANVGRAVKAYCNQTDPLLREKYRKLANAYAHPHNVEIHCIGDEDY